MFLSFPRASLHLCAVATFSSLTDVNGLHERALNGERCKDQVGVNDKDKASSEYLEGKREKKDKREV